MEYLTLAILAGVMYAVLIVPQQRRVRRQQELLASLVVGDDILTASGIYGTIVAIDEDDPNIMQVQIAEDVVVLMARSAVAEVAVEIDDSDDADNRSTSKGDDT